VLRVHAIRSSTGHYYDADCEVFPDPGQLLDGVQSLCARLEPLTEDATRRKRA